MARPLEIVRFIRQRPAARAARPRQTAIRTWVLPIDQVVGRRRPIDVCPLCGSAHVKNNGRYGDVIYFLCRDCGDTHKCVELDEEQSYAATVVRRRHCT